MKPAVHTELNRVVDEVPDGLRDHDHEEYGRTAPMSDEPAWREVLSRRLRFYVPYQKPCGCRFWCDRGLTDPVNYPDTKVHGQRTVVTSSGLSRRIDGYAVERTRWVAVCTCERCGSHFEVYIPFSGSARHYPIEEDG